MVRKISFALWISWWDRVWHGNVDPQATRMAHLYGGRSGRAESSNGKRNKHSRCGQSIIVSPWFFWLSCLDQYMGLLGKNHPKQKNWNMLSLKPHQWDFISAVRRAGSRSPFTMQCDYRMSSPGGNSLSWIPQPLVFRSYETCFASGSSSSDCESPSQVTFIISASWIYIIKTFCGGNIKL